MTSAHQKTMRDAGLPALKAVHGQSVSYRAASADARPITAIVGPERSEEISTRRGRVRVRMRDVTVTAADLPTPAINVDQIEVDGVIYTIVGRRRTDLDDGFVRLMLRTESVIESGRENYRDF